MRLQIRLVGVFISLEVGSLENHLQNTLHILIEDGFVQRSVLHTLHDGFVLLGQTGLQHVVARHHLCHSIFTTEPVGHHHTLEAPFVTQHRCLQLLVFRSIDTVQVVV